MRIGLSLHAERGVDAVLQEARLADGQGFATVWLGDHLLSGRGNQQPMDSLTLMIAVGAVTSRVRLAWATLNPSFRNPAVLAKMLATLDQISHGRVICSLGAGWMKEEYESYDLPFIEDHDARIDQECEVIQLLKQLWTHPSPERTTFEGQYVRVRDLPFGPAPYQQPYPPIWVGGNSEATQALAAEHADGWMLLTRGDTRGTLQQALSRPGWGQRPMEIVAGAQIYAAETEEQARVMAVRAFETARVPLAADLETFLRTAIVGTPEVCAEGIAELATWGITELRLSFPDLEAQSAFARGVLPLVGSRELQPAT